VLVVEEKRGVGLKRYLHFVSSFPASVVVVEVSADF